MKSHIPAVIITCKRCNQKILIEQKFLFLDGGGEQKAKRKACLFCKSNSEIHRKKVSFQMH
jgi:hypothetical protein